MEPEEIEAILALQQIAQQSAKKPKLTFAEWILSLPDEIFDPPPRDPIQDSIAKHLKSLGKKPHRD